MESRPESGHTRKQNKKRRRNIVCQLAKFYWLFYVSIPRRFFIARCFILPTILIIVSFFLFNGIFFNCIHMWLCFTTEHYGKHYNCKFPFLLRLLMILLRPSSTLILFSPVFD